MTSAIPPSDLLFFAGVLLLVAVLSGTGVIRTILVGLGVAVALAASSYAVEVVATNDTRLELAVRYAPFALVMLATTWRRPSNAAVALAWLWAMLEGLFHADRGTWPKLADHVALPAAGYWVVAAACLALALTFRKRPEPAM